jgi:dipeptidyl aminopeptidase/acylaminoacyl peptidase
MPEIRTAAFASLLVIVAYLGADAQVGNGPGFDPTPVTIPAPEKAAPHPVTSMDLLSIRDLHGVRISPDGHNVAFVLGQAIYGTNSYRSGLFVVGTEANSVPVSLGSVGPPHWSEAGEWSAEPPTWSPDSRYITYLVKAGATRQIWRWNRQGGRPVQLTHNDNDVQSFEWSPDGKSINFTVKKTADPKQAELLEQRGILYDRTISAWGQRPVVEEEMTKSEHKTQEWVYDVTTGEEEEVTTESRSESRHWRERFNERLLGLRQVTADTLYYVFKAKLSPDGTKVAYAIYVDDPQQSVHAAYPLYVMHLDSGPAINLTPGAVYVSDFWWSSDNRFLYFTEGTFDGHSPKLFKVAAQGGTARQLAGGAAEWADEFSLDSDGTRAACVRQRNTSPASIALMDFRSGETRTLVDPNPEFSNLQLSPATRIDWANIYGEAGHGYVIKPLHYEFGKRYPLIVTTYKSGDYFLRGGVGDEYPIQVFAANGFAVLAFDAGQDPNHKPGDFEAAKLRWKSPLASLDAALKILDHMEIVDSHRRGLTGLSYGSEITTFAISHSTLFQAAIVDGVGFPDPFFYYMADRTWRRIFDEWGLGCPEGEHSNRWREVSTALNAEHITAPVLSNEAETEYIAGLQTYSALEHLRKPVELFIYPNEGHVKNQPKHRYEIYERNLDWFKFWLQENEDASSAKREQYDRWHKLRDLRQKELSAHL